MNNYKVFRFMEILWLVIALAMAALSFWTLTTAKWDDAKFPLFATLCAGILYGLRRYQRIREAKKQV
jgi:hypothetical protein